MALRHFRPSNWFRRHVVSGRRLARDEKGATAVEFALLGVPFFALLGATLETALVFLASQVLDSGVDDATRLIRTGQAHERNFNATAFRNAVCQNVYGMFGDCSGIRIKVTTVSSFSTIAIASPVAATGPNAGEWTITEMYDHGGRSSIVLVEAYYKWPTILSLGGFNLADQPDGTRMLAAVRVFRNEPF